MVNKAKGKTLSSKDQLLQNIAARKQAALQKVLLTWWCEQIEAMKKMPDAEQMAHFPDLERNKKASDPFLAAEVGLYKLHLELSLWIFDPHRESDTVRDRRTVTIMRLVKGIVDRKCVTPSISAILSSVLICLGFAGYAPHLSAVSGGEIADRPLSFDFVKLIKSKKQLPYHEFMAITEHPVVWQLRLFGDYMDRSMDSQPDTRVSFAPDLWQRKVLDVIDKDGSLLVVGEYLTFFALTLLRCHPLAPTSAGKTFISFYAMEKVLRESDDGILVYIAPTKALVTQIAAEVYARFNKSLKGRSYISFLTFM
jgi:ATP-dependent RNA helicase DDX60